MWGRRMPHMKWNYGINEMHWPVQPVWPIIPYPGVCCEKSYVSNVRTFSNKKRTDLLVNVGTFRNVTFYTTDPWFHLCVKLALARLKCVFFTHIHWKIYYLQMGPISAAIVYLPLFRKKCIAHAPSILLSPCLAQPSWVAHLDKNRSLMRQKYAFLTAEKYPSKRYRSRQELNSKVHAKTLPAMLCLTTAACMSGAFCTFHIHLEIKFFPNPVNESKTLLVSGGYNLKHGACTRVRSAWLVKSECVCLGTGQTKWCQRHLAKFP